MKTKTLLIGLAVLVTLLVVQVALLNGQPCDGCKTDEKSDVLSEANQEKCPVMGGKINKEVFTDYNGKRVYFCCPGCDKPFLADPEKYLEKMRKNPNALLRIFKN